MDDEKDGLNIRWRSRHVLRVNDIGMADTMFLGARINQSNKRDAYLQNRVSNDQINGSNSFLFPVDCL